MKKNKSGVLIAIVAVSSAVAALTTLSVLAVRFIQKKRKEEEEDCDEVFDYTFDGSEIEAFQADDTCACNEENTAEDVPTDQ